MINRFEEKIKILIEPVPVFLKNYGRKRLYLDHFRFYMIKLRKLISGGIRDEKE